MGKSVLNVYSETIFFLIYEIGGAEDNTNTNATNPTNVGSISPESGKTTPPEGSITPETERTEEETIPQAGNQKSPTGIMILKTHIGNMKYILLEIYHLRLH